MRFRSVALALGLCLLASAALADPQTAAALRDRALNDNTAWDLLQSLTSEIGPRPTGSPAAARARDWAIARMTALGFTKVVIETAHAVRFE